MPSGVYFSGDFTFIAWIKINYYVVYGRIFDFGNGFASDNIGFGLINGTKLNTFTFSSSSQLSLTNSAFVINLNVWYHAAVVVQNTTGHIYMNGILYASGNLYVPKNVVRKTNYIGGSNFGNPNANAVYDEIKIYKGALTSAEVFNDYTAIDTFGARLLNYWPMNNLSDIVGEKDLFEGVNYLFTNDRFNNANSSIHFNDGFLKVPTGCYFSGDFSVVAWVKLNSNNPYQRLFDFANGPDMDNVC